MSMSLSAAKPSHWLPFIQDLDLIEWRDLIYRQLIPDSTSQTLDIFSQRIGTTIEAMRSILDSPEQMQRRMWQFISQSYLKQVETECYAHARRQMMTYLHLTDPI